MLRYRRESASALHRWRLILQCLRNNLVVRPSQH